MMIQHTLANVGMVLGSFLPAFQCLADVGTCLGGALLVLVQIPLVGFGTCLFENNYG